MCELFGAFVSEVVYIQVHDIVPVGNIVDFFSVGTPHGDDVLTGIVGDFFRFFAVEVENADVVSHSSLVSFPGPEFPEYVIVS